MEGEQSSKKILSLVETCVDSYVKDKLKRCKILDAFHHSFINGSEVRPCTLYGYKLQGKGLHDLPSELQGYVNQVLFENAIQEYAIKIPSKKQRCENENVDPFFSDLLRVENTLVDPESEDQQEKRYAAMVSPNGNFCFTLEQVGSGLEVYVYDKKKNYEKSLLTTLYTILKSPLEKINLFSVRNHYIVYSVIDTLEGEKKILQTFDGKLVPINNLNYVISDEGMSMALLHEHITDPLNPPLNKIRSLEIQIQDGYDQKTIKSFTLPSYLEDVALRQFNASYLLYSTPIYKEVSDRVISVKDTTEPNINNSEIVTGDAPRIEGSQVVLCGIKSGKPLCSTAFWHYKIIPVVDGCDTKGYRKKVIHKQPCIPQFYNENEDGYISHESLMKQIEAHILIKRLELNSNVGELIF